MTVSTGPHARFSAGSVQVKPWGHEHIYAEGEHGYVGKLLVVRAGEQLSLQYHVDKDETMVVVSGDALLAESSTAAPGWRDDVVRLADRYGRADTTHP